jgi:pSer/pThr/pTyr-binding forkhead associated (FHA) protein
VNKQRLSSRQPHPLNDGDELRLGKMVMTYYAS